MSVQNAMEIGAEPTALYRFYNARGALLYVGVTGNLAIRLGQHELSKPWWPEVTRKTMTWYESRSDALDAETFAIVFERPRHNVIGAFKPRPPREWAVCRNVASLLGEQIKSGRPAYGERLPSIGELKAAFSVSADTIVRALMALQKSGLIEAIGGGAFARYGTPPPQASTPEEEPRRVRRPRWLDEGGGPSPRDVARAHIEFLAADKRITYQAPIEEPGSVVVQEGVTMRLGLPQGAVAGDRAELPGQPLERVA